MPSKPVLFLDIDGVLNPWRRRVDTPSDYDDWELVPVECNPGEPTYNLWLSKQMAKDILELDVEIRWLTTWGRRAVNVAKEIGFPLDLPVAAEMPFMGRNNWKFAAVERFLDDEPGRPFIWIDDEAITAHAKEEVENSFSPSCLLVPDPMFGIPRNSFAHMSDWIEKVSAPHDGQS